MNFGEATIFTEIGHFYTNETYCPGCLNYLKGIDLTNCRPVLFIDNFFFPEIKLDIAALIKEAEDITGRRVEVFFEGDMVKYYNQALKLLDIRSLSTKSERGFTNLYFNGDKIAQLFPIFRPSCLMLSFIWTLFRLAHSKKILTIIDVRYAKLERKVVRMLPRDFVDRVNYKLFS